MSCKLLLPDRDENPLYGIMKDNATPHAFWLDFDRNDIEKIREAFFLVSIVGAIADNMDKQCNENGTDYAVFKCSRPTAEN